MISIMVTFKGEIWEMSRIPSDGEETVHWGSLVRVSKRKLELLEHREQLAKEYSSLVAILKIQNTSLLQWEAIEDLSAGIAASDLSGLRWLWLLWMHWRGDSVGTIA
jgi:hypothetical protein